MYLAFSVNVIFSYVSTYIPDYTDIKYPKIDSGDISILYSIYEIGGIISIVFIRF